MWDIVSSSRLQIVQMDSGTMQKWCMKGLVGSRAQPKENFDFFWNFFLPNPAMMKRVGKGLFHNMEDGFGGEQTIWVALPVVLVVVQRIKT